MGGRVHTVLGAIAGAAVASLVTLAAVETKAPVEVSVRDPAKVAAGILPRQDLTPGATLPVRKADICRPGYAKSVRNVTAEEKARVYASYGIKSHKPGAYEIDHLISLELGGSNDQRNLWPEKMAGTWGARTKDHFENVLHQRVCNGEENLSDAQAEISGDWTKAYVRYCGQPVGAGEKP